MLLNLARVAYLFAPLLLSALLSAWVMHAGWFEKYRVPIDGQRTFRGRRWFGDNKTWRGVVVAVLGAIVGVALQRLIPPSWLGAVLLVDYGAINVPAFGCAMGLGATAGELPNSFVKRQLAIAPGEHPAGVSAAFFFVWDQVDTLTLTWLFLLPWLRPTLALFVCGFLYALALHPLLSWLGYLLHVRSSPR